MSKCIDELLNIPPYSLTKVEKEKMLFHELKELTEYHSVNCEEYGKIISSLQYKIEDADSMYNIPMVPVKIFKDFELRSVSKDKVKKVITSSGTSNQKVSRIFLDEINIKNQTKVLTHIVNSYVGDKRLPMIILDSNMVVKDRKMFSARGAGVVGFSIFGRNKFYALDENMNLNLDGMIEFINEHKDERIILFGYTYIIWKHIVNELKNRGISLDVNDGILFHVGGWKKIQSEGVDWATYNRTLKSMIGNIEIYNYYGMAEQLGSIYMECEHGHMHCSNFSDIIIRRSDDFSIADFGESGIIELISVIPSSYPGHAILTEDQGVILGEDDCPCGRKGKYFQIEGRLKHAEIRGCSDTYAAGTK